MRCVEDWLPARLFAWMAKWVAELCSGSSSYSLKLKARRGLLGQ